MSSGGPLPGAGPRQTYRRDSISLNNSHRTAGSGGSAPLPSSVGSEPGLLSLGKLTSLATGSVLLNTPELNALVGQVEDEDVDEQVGQPQYEQSPSCDEEEEEDMGVSGSMQWTEALELQQQRLQQARPRRISSSSQRKPAKPSRSAQQQQLQKQAMHEQQQRQQQQKQPQAKQAAAASGDVEGQLILQILARWMGLGALQHTTVDCCLGTIAHALHCLLLPPCWPSVLEQAVHS